MGFRRGVLFYHDLVNWLNRHPDPGATLAEMECRYLGFFGIPCDARLSCVHDPRRSGNIHITVEHQDFPYATPEEAPEEVWGEAM